MRLTIEEDRTYRELTREFAMLQMVQMHQGSLREYTKYLSSEFVAALKSEINRVVLRIAEIEPQLLELAEKQGGGR